MKCNELFESEETKYHYVGNCVNSFDSDGDCSFKNYSDVTEFAQGLENATKVSKMEFLKHVKAIKTIDKCDMFEYDADADVYIAYDTAADIHYFFTK
jgi:hypothetical protein